MSHVLSFTLEINNFPCLTNFSCRYIHHIRSHAVSGELPIDISGISSHLIGIFGTNDLQGLYHVASFALKYLNSTTRQSLWKAVPDMPVNTRSARPLGKFCSTAKV